MDKIDITSIINNGRVLMGIKGFNCPKCGKELAISGLNGYKTYWYCLNSKCIVKTVNIEIVQTKKVI